jgi:hypothetical protein
LIHAGSGSFIIIICARIKAKHQRHQHLPGELHHLIDADAWEGAFDPLNHDVNKEGLRKEVNRPQQRHLPGELTGPLPAAQEERHGNCTQEEAVQELRQEEHGKLHAGVFDVEAGDQFGFSLKQVEGRLFALCQR